MFVVADCRLNRGKMARISTETSNHLMLHKVMVLINGVIFVVYRVLERFAVLLS